MYNIRYATCNDFELAIKTTLLSFLNYDFIETLAGACKFKNKSIVIDYKNDKILIPLIERRAVKLYPVAFGLPFGLYGGILSENKIQPELYKEILKIAVDFIKCGIVVQNPFDQNFNLSGLDVITNSYTHFFRLKDITYDFLFKNIFESKLRNQIRKAEKSDLNIKSGNNESFVDEFYYLYLLSNRRWGRSKPKYSIGFFKSFINKPYFEIQISYFQNKPVSGIVLIKLNSQYFYWFGAMDKNYGKFCPNHLILTKAIREAIDSGFEIFNFGASGKLTSVKQFKDSFHAEEKPYNIYFIGNPIVKAGLSLMIRKGN